MSDSLRVQVPNRTAGEQISTKRSTRAKGIRRQIVDRFQDKAQDLDRESHLNKRRKMRRNLFGANRNPKEPGKRITLKRKTKKQKLFGVSISRTSSKRTTPPTKRTNLRRRPTQQLITTHQLIKTHRLIRSPAQATAA